MVLWWTILKAIKYVKKFCLPKISLCTFRRAIYRNISTKETISMRIAIKHREFTFEKRPEMAVKFLVLLP